MRISSERSQMIDTASEWRSAPAPSKPELPVWEGENAVHGTPEKVLAAVKRASLKRRNGIRRIGKDLSGPPMNERDRFQYAAIASKIQIRKVIAANWPQCPSR